MQASFITQRNRRSKLGQGLGWLLAGVLCAGCHGKTPPNAASGAPEGPTIAQRSDATDRKSVAITVYNQNFGLVREIRDLKLGRGRVSLSFGDVSAHIQPETVHIRSVGDGAALTVLEQNYRYDLLTPQKLLDKYVGKKVRVYRYNEKLGTDEVHDAAVLSVEGGTPVLKLDGEITYGFGGRIAFPEVPDNLISKPTLVWLLGSKAERQRVEVTYLTQNLGWHTDYVLVVDRDSRRGDLTGWVTLSNTSGTSYNHARLKLVAGDVQRLLGGDARYPQGTVAADDDEGERQFSEEGFFEYHLYTLERPTDLLDKEQKQVSLLEAHDIAIHKKLIFYGASQYYRGRYGQVVSNQKVGVYLDIQNAEKNHLGIPLPKGIVRVYQADRSGAQQFIGEDRIDHTPRDEKLRIKMGEAFDVVGDRKQTDWTTLGVCTARSSWEISLRNHKDAAEQVEVYEPVGGDWEIESSSHRYQKHDAHSFSFEVVVPANGETKISYRVRIRWC